MHSLIFYFINRKIIVELWHQTKIDQSDTENGAKDLVNTIDALLKRHKLDLTKLNKIGLLNGPGSFTSIRILLATVIGISAGRNIQIYPFRLEELVSGEIYLEIGRNLYYIYTDEWRVVKSGSNAYQKFSPDDTIGIEIYTRMNGIPAELVPFYLTM